MSSPWLGNNGAKNVLSSSYGSVFGSGIPNWVELVANGPPYSGFQYSNPLILSGFFPSGVPFGGFPQEGTDDGIASIVAKPTGAGAGIDTKGYQESCVSYDNSATGYCDLGNIEWTNPPVSSIAAWVQVPNINSQGFIICFFGIPQPGTQLAIYVSSTGDVLGGGRLILDMAGPGTRGYTATGLIPFNQPFHVAVVANAHLSTSAIYINGVLTPFTLEGADQSINVGTNGHDYFNAVAQFPSGNVTAISGPGTHYSMKCYTNALSGADVLDLYTLGFSNRHSGWTMWNELPVLPGIHHASFTLSVTIPACATRDQELAYAEYACRAAARQARAAGGQVTTGTIQAQPNVLPGVQTNLATYVYNPVAPQ